jgi:hypothetical protein
MYTAQDLTETTGMTTDTMTDTITDLTTIMTEIMIWILTEGRDIINIPIVTDTAGAKTPSGGCSGLSSSFNNGFDDNTY